MKEKIPVNKMESGQEHKKRRLRLFLWSTAFFYLLSFLMLHYVSSGRQLPWSEKHYPFSMQPQTLRFSLEASGPIALLLGITVLGLDWARKDGLR